MRRFRKLGKFRSQSGSLSLELSSALFEKTNDGIIVTDSAGRCRQVNTAACRMMGYTRDELLRLPFADIFSSTKTNPVPGRSGGPNPGTSNAGEMMISRKDGSVLRVLMEVHSLEDGSYLSILRDISRQKDAETELRHIVRLYETLARINNVTQRAKDRESLYREICEVAASSGGFSLAAVGVLDEQGETLTLVAWKGTEQDTPPYGTVELNMKQAEGALFTRAVRSRKVVTSDDLQTERLSAFWHDEAVRRNLHSGAAVPFRIGGKIVGVLSLIAADLQSFQERDFQLLDAIGRGVSFGLEKIEEESGRRNAELALASNEERYHSAFENTAIGLYRTTPDGKILMANQALLKLLGYETLEELQQRDLTKEGFEPDYSREDFISRIEAEGVINGLESGWTRTDGAAVYLRESARAVRGPDGKTLFYEGSIEDITDKKLAELTILDKTTLLDEMSRLAKIGGWEFDTSDMKGTWTDETARIHGLDPAAETNATLGLSFYEGEHKERIETAVREAIEEGRPYDIELEMTAADGTKKWVRTIGHPIKKHGKVVKLRGMFQDITEAKHATDRIRYLTRLYASLSQVNQMIVRTRDEMDLYREICSLSLEFGEFPLVAIGLYDKQEHSVKLIEWKGSGVVEQPYSTIDIELPQYKDGLLSTAIRRNTVVTSDDVPSLIETKHWREVLLKYGLNVAAAVPFRLNGEIVGVLTLYAHETDIFMPEIIKLLEEMALDISFALDSIGGDRERRRNEEALKEERDRIAVVAEMAPGLIHSFRMRPDGTACMPYASSAIVDVYGHSQEEVKDDLSPIFAHFHPDDVSHINETIAESARTMTMWHDEFRYLHPVKGEIWIEGKSKPVLEPDGSITWHGFIQDITDRRRSEQALRDSEERFRSIAEQMNDTIFITKSDGVIEFVSPYCLQMFGFTQEEMEGRDFRDFLLEDDVPLAVERFSRTQQTGGVTRNLELRMKRKDGSVFVSELNSSYFVDDRFAGAMGVIRDVTERKNAEAELMENEAKRHELESQLLQAQKLESLGTLAGGIAHDFNNILGVIMGYSALLKDGSLDDAGARRSTEAIERASERGAGLVSQLLTFARKSETVFASVSVNEIVRDALSLLYETFPRTIRIESNLNEDIPMVTGDVTQLHQVLMNLCINARDAMPDGGSVVITTALVADENVPPKLNREGRSRYVALTVRDSGVGMDEETKRQIFDPFFTTKEAGKGTGLGLALVYSIASNHGGSVDVESEPGSGTAFTVYLPAISAGRGGAEEAPAASNEIAGGSETIMIVEDEDMLRDILETVLTRRGYSVVMAKNGREALELYDRKKDDIHAVITDLGLPELGGDEVFMRIKSDTPAAKIIVASGFIDPEVRSRLSEAGAKHFIQKPYVPSEILRTLRTVLDSSD